MKVPLLVILTTLTLEQIMPQSPKANIGGLFDIKWGESSEVVQRKMLAREGITVNPNSPHEDKDLGELWLYFDKGSFMGYGVDSWYLQFHDNKFYKVTMTIEDLSETMLENIYCDLVGLFTQKYGRRTESNLGQSGMVEMRQRLLPTINADRVGAHVHWFLRKSSIAIYGSKIKLFDNEKTYRIMIFMEDSELGKQAKERETKRKLKDIN